MAIASSTSATAPATPRIHRQPGAASPAWPSAEPFLDASRCARAAKPSLPSAAPAEHDAGRRTERHRTARPPGEIHGPPLEPKRHGWRVRRVDQDETTLEVPPEHPAPAVPRAAWRAERDAV